MEDEPGNSGCVYAFKRISGSHPISPDLIDYDPVGDQQAPACLPTSDTCGAILPGPGFSASHTGDVPAYRWDFLGRWTVDKWKMGADPGALGTSVTDLIKWRGEKVSTVNETEEVWDLYHETSWAGSFIGYIDGKVRVVRMIMSAQSGPFVTRYEFAYPGEVVQTVYYRVHDVIGPVYTYPDVHLANASPGEAGKVYTQSHHVAPFDTIGSPSPAGSYSPYEWYAVASPIGSYLVHSVDWRETNVGDVSADYFDSTDPHWTPQKMGIDDWDTETGDHGAPRTLWTHIGDTQNTFCDASREESPETTAFLVRNTIMLSHGEASGSDANAEMTRRNRGVFSVCVEEEPLSGGGGGACSLEFHLAYNRDGGAVELGASGCPESPIWNLYQQVGAGVYKRLASLPLGVSFFDVNLALGEERTYRASAMGAGCEEGEMSDPVTVIHDDVVPPGPPPDVVATAGQDTITVTWNAPAATDVDGFKVLVGQQSSGPYSQTHQGLLGRLVRDHTFPASGGQTYYVVVVAVDMAANEGDPSLEAEVAVP